MSARNTFHAFTGEGLGWLWPFLAGYPKDKIALIDAACAMRPTSKIGADQVSGVRSSQYCWWLPYGTCDQTH